MDVAGMMGMAHKVAKAKIAMQTRKPHVKAIGIGLINPRVKRRCDRPKA
jgi:hypothetical protein